MDQAPHFSLWCIQCDSCENTGISFLTEPGSDNPKVAKGISLHCNACEAQNVILFDGIDDDAEYIPGALGGGEQEPSELNVGQLGPRDE